MYPGFDVVAAAVIVVVLGHVTLAISGSTLYTQIHAYARLMFSSNKPKALEVSFLIPVQLPGFSDWPDMFLNHKFKNPVLIIMLMSFYIVAHLE